ncbi:MAG: replicative DNA helicase, partial [Gammaproteobacteria bacterium]|nr:replicative DNA helicase [Gammaproteobacteria bacterium]
MSDAELDKLKIPPHSVEAEQSILGGLMLDNSAWDRIADRLVEADFYRTEHKLIFRVMFGLSKRNQPFDVITLSESLKALKELDNAGGDVYLFELAKNTPTVANVEAYADIVRERSILRQLLTATNTIASNAFNPLGQSSKEILNSAESTIFKIAEQQTRGSGPVDISALLATATERIDTLYHSDQDITGLATGFKELDDITSGLQDGDLVIVAGRPSMGKTTFAMNVAEHAAIQEKKPVLVFSMEMPGESLAMRIMSSHGRIDQHRIRTGKLEDEDWPRLTSAVSVLSETTMFIDDTPAMNPAELCSRARRVARAHGQLGLIVIDYMQLMQIAGFRENRTAELTEISRSLKGLAKELKVPVVALSQLNR